MYPTIEQAISDRLRLHLGPAGPVLAPVLRVQLRPRLGVGIDQLRPVDHVGSIGAPLLVITGTLDQHTPIEEARALFAAASEPKEFWAIEGAAHVNLHRYAKEEYERRVLSFFAANLNRLDQTAVTAP